MVAAVPQQRPVAAPVGLAGMAGEGKCGSSGPVWNIARVGKSARLNTPTSGRQRMRGSQAPPWLRVDPKPGSRRVEAPNPAPAPAAEPRTSTAPAVKHLTPPSTVNMAAPPLKPRSERRWRLQPVAKVRAGVPVRPAAGPSIPYTRRGGWTPRWEPLQLARADSGSASPREGGTTASPRAESARRAAAGRGDAALCLVASEETSGSAASKDDPWRNEVSATAVRSPVGHVEEPKAVDSFVYYKFSPRLARRDETDGRIAARRKDDDMH